MALWAYAAAAYAVVVLIFAMHYFSRFARYVWQSCRGSYWSYGASFLLTYLFMLLGWWVVILYKYCWYQIHVRSHKH